MYEISNFVKMAKLDSDFFRATINYQLNFGVKNAKSTINNLCTGPRTFCFS